METGEATGYALNMVQERGRLMMKPRRRRLYRHDRRRKFARK
jgi:predicted membrane GTPase involved in stress response